MDGLSMQQLEHTPAMKPPPGFTTDFSHPGKDGSNTTQTIIVLAFLTSLTFVVLLLRLYTRFVVLGKPGWDDYCAAAATVGAIAYAGLVIYVFVHGFGVHQWNVPLATLLELTNYLNAILYIYKPVMLLAKLSLCIFFLQIFGRMNVMRWAIYFAIGYNVVLQVAAFFLAIFLCIPGKPSFWKCSRTVSVLNVSTSGCNIFADFFLLLIPLFGIKQLQMSKARKWGLSLIFGVGLLACVASLLGLIYRIKQNNSPDDTWSFSPEIILVTFELEATIMVGCLMVMPVLFRSRHPYSFGFMWSHRSELLKKILMYKWSSHSTKDKSLPSSDETSMHEIEPKSSPGSARNGQSAESCKHVSSTVDLV